MGLDLWIVRHGESLGNLDGSDADTDLSPLGEEQARALRAVLAGVGFDRVWTSPLLRARRTAELAMPGSEPIVDDRLAELEAEPPVQVLDTSRLGPEEILAALSARPRRAVESGKDFMARVRAFRADLPAAGRVVVFTHAGVVREILAAILGFRRAPGEVSHAALFRLAIDPAEVTVLAWNASD
jgi:broad specificity phosphatase PhoE